MDVSLLIKQRLNELALDQKDLAAAIQVTESYISQLLARKKAPPAPARTDLYDKMGVFLKLPPGELSKMADLQRQFELKKKVGDTPEPLLKDSRDLLLRKCQNETRDDVQQVFDKDPFGDLERLVTQTLLEVAQSTSRVEAFDHQWLTRMAQLNSDTPEQMRAAVHEFLCTDVFHISSNQCMSFIDPIIDSWSIDMKTFRMDIRLNSTLSPGGVRRFEFLERPDYPASGPGLDSFLKDKSLSGDASDDEIEFLKSLRFKKRQPSALYYYRELQNLRDPLHFPTAE